MGLLIGLLALIVIAGFNSAIHEMTLTPAEQAAEDKAQVAKAQAEQASATEQPSSSAVGPSSPPAHSNGGLDYLTLKAQSEEKLDAVLSDSSGVRYRDVQTRLSTMDGGGIVAFCGEENSKTPMGGYGGFKRFIASRSVATTEDGMSPEDFEQAWSRFCTDGVEGPRVWF